MWKLVIEDDESKRTVGPLTRDDYTIGRQEGNTIRLSERNVSRSHGRIRRKRNGASKDVFVLGLGTGVSAAAIARYPVRSIEIADIESGSREAAQYFAQENRNILADPRVTFLVADGRNALLARKKSYDVILSDPSDTSPSRLRISVG